MTPAIVRLGPEDIVPLRSTYLSEGRKQESWQIDEVEIEGDRLRASVSMQSVYVSSTDSKGFHLTVFSTLEFLSQLTIIYGHVWAGLREKSREVWMVESSIRCIKAIRHADRIRVDMTVRSMRKHRGSLYCSADFRVTDESGGLFQASLTAFVS